MKITVYTHPPAGYSPQPVLKIFSPIDDPSVCVMCQLHKESDLILSPGIAWVAIPTERVEKIKFVNNQKPNEQIQDEHSRRPGRD